MSNIRHSKSLEPGSSLAYIIFFMIMLLKSFFKIHLISELIHYISNKNKSIKNCTFSIVVHNNSICCIAVNNVKLNKNLQLCTSTLYLLLFDCHCLVPSPFKRFPILVLGFLVVVFRTARKEMCCCSCV